jgi:MerR family transcriptional regulator/heat shock protein HspR
MGQELIMARSKDEPVYAISIAARLVEMHPQTLRLYERLGLIKPTRVDRNRLYSEADIEKLQRIQRLTKDMGVNLAGVEIILKLLEQMDQMRVEMETEIAQMEQELLAAQEAGLLNTQLPIPVGRSGLLARRDPLSELVRRRRARGERRNI